jgi:hypothetical protein
MNSKPSPATSTCWMRMRTGCSLTDLFGLYSLLSWILLSINYTKRHKIWKLIFRVSICFYKLLQGSIKIILRFLALDAVYTNRQTDRQTGPKILEKTDASISISHTGDRSHRIVLNPTPKYSAWHHNAS